MKLNKTHECLNCHEQIGDSNYCPNCGQLNTDKKLPVRLIVEDFLGDYITFDSKFFKSLFPLLFKPGYLTTQYLSGKRTTYIFPFRLYLFTTFVFFFIIAITTKIDSDFLAELPENNKSDSSNVKIEDEEIAKDSLISILDNYSTFIPESKLKEIKEKIESGSDDSTSQSDNEIFKITVNDEEDDNSIIQYIEKKAEYLSNREDGAAIFWKETLNQLPKVLFILLPLFALILKLLFMRHKIFYVEHLIFSLHFHTFIFIHLLLVVFFPYWYVTLFVILSFHVYLFLALRNVYRQSMIKTLFKMILLLGSYTFVLIPGFIVLILLAVVSV